VGTPKARYYAIHRGFTTPKASKTMRRLIPADQLEKTIVDIIRDMLLSTPDLRARLIGQIEAQQTKLDADATDVDQLEKEREKISQQIEFVIDSLGTVGQQAAKAKLQQLEAKLMTVVARIDQAQSTKPEDERSAESIADEMIAKLTEVAATIRTMPLPTLRPLLMALIARLEVDMATKTVQLDLAIPACMGKNGLCLEDKSSQRFVHEAQYEIPLESAECRYRRIGRNPCFECRRLRQAA
jgi:hypothetical protein